MRSKTIAGLIVILLLISCSQTHKQKSERGRSTTDNYVKLCFGIETIVDTSNFMEHAIYQLNTSDYEGCFTVIKTQFPALDTMQSDDMSKYGLIIPAPHTENSHYNPLNYLSFRYNDFVGSLPPIDQHNLLLDGMNSEDTLDDLIKLQKAESFFVLAEVNFKPDSGTMAKRAIHLATSLQQNMTQRSRRLEYIIATSYLLLNDDIKALPIYEKLIGEKYYALLCLKNIVRYLGEKKRNEEQQHYIAILHQLFPNYPIR